MSNRWMVIEAYADHDTRVGDTVRMQVLNIHASVSAAYWYWPSDEYRLTLIDLKTQRVFQWSEAFRLMCYENLVRLEAERRITPKIQAVLLSYGLIEGDNTITDTGREQIAEFRPPPAIELSVGHIKSTVRLYK